MKGNYNKLNIFKREKKCKKKVKERNLIFNQKIIIYYDYLVPNLSRCVL